MNGLWAMLQSWGLLPADYPPPPESAAAVGTDLLPQLIDAWAAAHRRGTSRRRAAEAVLPQLRRLQARRAQLTYSVSGAAGARADRWLGPRLFLWPWGVPRRRLVGLVSSRLGRDLTEYRPWFTVLRAACMNLDGRRELLLTAETTAAQRFVRRGGELFGLDVLHLDFPRDWAAAVLNAAHRTPAAGNGVLVSPPLAEMESASADALAGLPTPDRAIVALSDRLVGLHARRGGHVERLLRGRLADAAFPPASVYIALGPNLTPRDVADELLAARAVGWFVQKVDEGEVDWGRERKAEATAPIVPADSLAQDEYLIHCTRSRPGPWPNEPAENFLDDLILDRAGADHSAFAALWRIVQSQRLIAAADMVRGDTPVVSFTAVPLRAIGDRRAFRSHLSRWDFEPYGLAIHREWLVAHDARPVCYGDEATWEQLSDDDRPFFQMRESHSPGGRVMDWTVEREWRHLGDVPLAEIPAAAAFLFVPTERQARQLAAVSRWPVTVAPVSV